MARLTTSKLSIASSSVTLKKGSARSMFVVGMSKAGTRRYRMGSDQSVTSVHAGSVVGRQWNAPGIHTGPTKVATAGSLPIAFVPGGGRPREGRGSFGSALSVINRSERGDDALLGVGIGLAPPHAMQLTRIGD